MKYIIIISSVMLILNGCEKKDNSVSPVTESPLSASEVLNNSYLFTFSINKDIFDINDTIKASLIATNIGTIQDTVLISCMGIKWTLKNANGMTVMHSRDSIVCNSIRKEFLAPGQSTLIGGIYEAIPNDTTLKGAYVLNTMDLSLNISLQ